jgi:hypothetical protein
MQFFGLFLVLAVLLLAIPVQLLFALKREGSWRGRIIVYWMFGLVRVPLRPGRKSAERRSKRRERTRKLIVAGARGAARRRRQIYLVLRSRGVAGRLVRLLRDLLRSLRPRRFRVRFIIGLDDPADTGRLMGVIAPLRVLINRRDSTAPNISIRVTPDYAGSRFTGYSCASVRFVPLRMMWLVLAFLFSAPVLRAMRMLITSSDPRSPTSAS